MPKFITRTLSTFLVFSLVGQVLSPASAPSFGLKEAPFSILCDQGDSNFSSQAFAVRVVSGGRRLFTGKWLNFKSLIEMFRPKAKTPQNAIPEPRPEPAPAETVRDQSWNSSDFEGDEMKSIQTDVLAALIYVSRQWSKLKTEASLPLKDVVNGCIYVSHDAEWVTFESVQFPNLLFKIRRNNKGRRYREIPERVEMGLISRMSNVVRAISVDNILLTSIPGLVPFRYEGGVLIQQKTLPLNSLSESDWTSLNHQLNVEGIENRSTHDQDSRKYGKISGRLVLCNFQNISINPEKVLHILESVSVPQEEPIASEKWGEGIRAIRKKIPENRIEAYAIFYDYYDGGHSSRVAMQHALMSMRYSLANATATDQPRRREHSQPPPAPSDRPQVPSALIEHMIEIEDCVSRAVARYNRPGLSPRLREVLGLIAEGKSIPEIKDRLQGPNLRSIGKYVSDINKKLRNKYKMGRVVMLRISLESNNSSLESDRFISDPEELRRLVDQFLGLRRYRLPSGDEIGIAGFIAFGVPITKLAKALSISLYEINEVLITLYGQLNITGQVPKVEMSRMYLKHFPFKADWRSA